MTIISNSNVEFEEQWSVSSRAATIIPTNSKAH